ncbi:MAG TPA: PEP-CTERM sorting domain-containing protein [Acetobacteraceae bacterium]|nr:PEP-CTERM sorting domain-containing protein [Acetobacteraceae bacterium]
MNTLKKVLIAGAVAAVAYAAANASAAELVTDGGFESNGGNGQLGYNTSATGWSVPSGSYTFLFAPGTADTSGANGQYGGLSLWGPGNGVANGLPAASPAGGYFIASDSDFQQGAVSQTINGLTVGKAATLTFWWAAAQQSGFNGATQSQWEVSLGSQTQDTAFAIIPNHGFSGWISQTFTFTPTSTSELLSFFANGSPQVPPFALLDGVSLTQSSVPEPGTLALVGLGLAGFGLIRRRARRR